MDEAFLRRLLDRYRSGEASLETTLSHLRHMPFEDLGYARIDHHRSVRTGIPEAIYCEGKNPEQVRGIAMRMAERHENILATRAEPPMFEAIREVVPDCRYFETARIVVIRPRPAAAPIGRIAVVTAGTSDMAVAEEAAVTAESLGHRVHRIYDAGVAGLHRILHAREALYTANVAVVVAGMDGALASVVGGLVPCPVVGVPTSVGYGASLGGIAALLTMLNSCAPGVSVVNIDNGFGAGVLAGRINRLAAAAERPDPPSEGNSH